MSNTDPKSVQAPLNTTPMTLEEIADFRREVEANFIHLIGMVPGGTHARLTDDALRDERNNLRLFATLDREHLRNAELLELSQWIAAEEQLPSDDDTFDLCLLIEWQDGRKQQGYSKGYYDGVVWHYTPVETRGDFTIRVTHWKKRVPLPPLPAG